MAGDSAICADDDDMVVFLQGDHDFACVVDRDEFGFRVIARDGGKACHVDLLQGGAIDGPVGDGQFHHETGRHLRDRAIVHILIAFVFNGDREKAAVGGFGHRIRLAADIAGGGDAAAGKVDGRKGAGGGGEGADVFTPTKALPPMICAVVGSPPTSMLPNGLGAAGSVMSISPTTPSGLSV